jgi:hypothetical protein
MGKNRLNSLLILNIEVDLTKTINFNDIIETFTSQN